MFVRTACLASLLVCTSIAVPALASSASIHASPNPVHRGHVVRVYGADPGCTVGDQVTLISKAFSHRHDFAGLPAVFARVGADHTYSVRTTIPASRKPGRYQITGRCGGGNLGVTAPLRVLR